MTTLLPESKQENIKRSFWAWVDSHYSETPLYRLGQPGFDTTRLNEWVEMALQVASREFLRHIDSVRTGVLGNLASYYLSTEIFVRPTDDFLRVDHIRDVLVDMFLRAKIPVLDYVGTQAEVGSMIGRDILVDIGEGFENDLNRYFLGFHLEYLEAINGQ